METGEAGKTLAEISQERHAGEGREEDGCSRIGRFVEWGKNGDPVVMPLLGTTGFSD